MIISQLVAMLVMKQRNCSFLFASTTTYVQLAVEQVARSTDKELMAALMVLLALSVVLTNQ